MLSELPIKRDGSSSFIISSSCSTWSSCRLRSHPRRVLRESRHGLLFLPRPPLASPSRKLQCLSHKAHHRFTQVALQWRSAFPRICFSDPGSSHVAVRAGGRREGERPSKILQKTSFLLGFLRSSKTCFLLGSSRRGEHPEIPEKTWRCFLQNRFVQFGVFPTNDLLFLEVARCCIRTFSRHLVSRSYSILRVRSNTKRIRCWVWL